MIMLVLIMAAGAEAIFFPEEAENGMVVTRCPHASRVGVRVLEQGGNAIDAAVATGFALAVTQPSAGNLGGGGFLLYYEAKSGEVHALDYRETAPAKATRDMFVGKDGKVDQDLARWSHQSAGVPGTVAGFDAALNRFGTMSLAEAVAPAIPLAKEGFPIPPNLGRALAKAREPLAKWEASKAIFLDAQGAPHRAGHLLVQKDLARTLEDIAREGPDGFYRGRVAKLLVEEMQRHGGLISHEDLAAYKPVFRKPVQGEYKGHTVYSMPPPSSGGIHLIQMLKMLEKDDLGGLGHNSAASIHLMTEAMRRAFADRSKFLGDPDVVEVPVAGLLSAGYVQGLRNSIDPDRASKSRDVRPGKPPGAESFETTTFCVVDKEGNAVSNTYTLNAAFGSGIVVAGAGFLLNNEMDDFSAQPGAPNLFGLVGGEANAIAPGKRMLSSMTPTIVTREGKPILVTGAVGGPRIITAVLQVVLNVLDHGLNVQEAINAPRIHHQWLPDTLWVEPGVSPDTIRLLRDRGHKVEVGAPKSNAAAIFIDRGKGTLEGAGDPRRDGVAAGY